MNRKKILYIVSTLQGGGPINQLYEIVRNLDMNMFEAYILTLSPEVATSKLKLFSDLPIEISFLNMNRVSFIFGGNKKMMKEIERISPDIIHTNGIRADICMARMNLNDRWCNTIHNSIYQDYIPRYGKVIGSIMSCFHIAALKKNKYPICCSNTLMNYYSNMLKKDFYSIQNGVNSQIFQIGSTEERAELKDRLGVPKNRKVLISVGGLNKIKDPLTIINAFAKLEKKDKYILYVLGDGVLMKECQQAASDNTFFLGKIPNVYDYMKIADGYISASTSEGLPTSVLEAGACGLPMILSDIPQHREIYGDLYEGIRYFETKNEKSFLEIFEEWISKIDNYDRSLLRNHIVENFDGKVTSKKYQDFYCRIINK